jgi:DNA repair exonuclease SbcCD nuclease subunit
MDRSLFQARFGIATDDGPRLHKANLPVFCVKGNHAELTRKWVGHGSSLMQQGGVGARKKMLKSKPGCAKLPA